MKDEFILNEIWFLTISGAFQRANVYVEGINDNEKTEFKNQLKEFVTNIALQYKNDVNESEHLKNIQNILNEFSSYPKVKLNYGISQKVLNLYLKYLWCLEKIVTPPHFPVDRIIQEKLKMGTNIKAWTKMENDEHYNTVINLAKDMIKDNTNYNKIAELELELFAGKEIRK